VKDLPEEKVSELLNQIRAGDDKAVTTLFLHYRDRLYAFVRLQVTADHEAEDIVQDVFLAAFRQLDRFRGEAEFSTWLWAIAGNKVADLYRAQKRKGLITVIDEEMEDSLPDPNWDFVEQLEAKEMAQALIHCQASLPVAQKEAIYWVFYQELGVNDAAQRQSCPPGTVKSRLYHARKQLADCLSRWLQETRYG